MSMNEQPIKAVEALPEYILRVEWQSGSVTLLNMRPILTNPRFRVLKDESVWRSAATDGRTIRWRDEKGFPYDMAEYEVNRFASGYC